MADMTLREHVDMTLGQMVPVRAPYEQDWEEISRLALPARSDLLGTRPSGIGMDGRVNITTASQGDRKRRSNTKSRDSYGARAARTLTSGMHSGLSPSSSPWFKLTTTDPDLAEYQSVKEWLAIVQRLIYTFLSDIGAYDTFKLNYAELGCFGIGAGTMIEHMEYGGVTTALTAGEYWIGLDDGLRADQLMRRCDFTVRQLQQFVGGNEALLSRAVRNLIQRKSWHTIVPCMHLIERNPDYDPTVKMGLRSFLYRSVWVETGNTDKNMLLRKSGYSSKMFWAPRWESVGSRVYSDAAPGFMALPDLREMQLAARRRGSARDKLVLPPMKVPIGLQSSLLRLDAGSLNYAAASDLEGLVPLYTTPYQAVQTLREDHNELRNDVGSAFFTDLFMAISQREGVQPLNDLETSLRDAEKYTQLGPVVDRVNVEMLEVVIDRAYEILDRTGQIPPAPKEVQGVPLIVDFVSMLAQAQRASENAAIERTARFVGYLAGIYPEAAAKFDAMQAIDEFATGTGTPPKIIRSDQVVEKMVAEQQQKQQQMETAAMAQPMRDGAQAAELLSRTQVDPSGRSALQAILQQ